MKRAGYILVETLVALSVLSISVVVIHNALRQAVLTRAQAHDYAAARLLLDQKLAEIELQEKVPVTARDGAFPPPFERFRYRWEVSQIQVPMPAPPPDRQLPNWDQIMDQFQPFMGKVRIEILWSRAGIDGYALGETLLPPEKLWLPQAQPQ